MLSPVGASTLMRVTDLVAKIVPENKLEEEVFITTQAYRITNGKHTNTFHLELLRMTQGFIDPYLYLFVY